MSLLFLNIVVADKERCSNRCARVRNNMPLLLALIVIVALDHCNAENTVASESVVSPSISLGTKYSDNIFFSAQDAESDFYTVLTPAVQLLQRNERGELAVKGKIDSFSYADNSSLNSLDSEVSANGSYALSPLFSFNASSLHKVDSQADREIASSGLISTNSKREQNRESLGLEWALSEKTVVGSQASYSTMRYEDKDYSDMRSGSYNLSVRSDLSQYLSETTGFVDLAQRRYDYEGSQVSDYTTVTIGLEKKLNEQYSILAWVGPSLIETDYDNPYLQAGKEWGVTAHCSVDAEFETSSLRLSLTNEVAPDNFSNTTVERTTVGGGWSKQISADMRVGIWSSYFLNESSGSDAVFNRNSGKKTLNILPRITYKISDNFTVEAEYGYSRVEYTDYDSNIERNSFFINFRWGIDNILK